MHTYKELTTEGLLAWIFFGGKKECVQRSAFATKGIAWQVIEDVSGCVVASGVGTKAR